MEKKGKREGALPRQGRPKQEKYATHREKKGDRSGKDRTRPGREKKKGLADRFTTSCVKRGRGKQLVILSIANSSGKRPRRGNGGGDQTLWRQDSPLPLPEGKKKSTNRNVPRSPDSGKKKKGGLPHGGKAQGGRPQ